MIRRYVYSVDRRSEQSPWRARRDWRKLGASLQEGEKDILESSCMMYKGVPGLSLAIVWPANPNAVNDSREADPELHRTMLESQEAVYWDSMPRRRGLTGPLDGYIYIHGLVRYRCVVDEVLTLERLLERQDEDRYVPEFRRQCLFGQYPDGTPHPRSNTWIRVSRIDPLDPPLELSCFRKWNGEELRRVQGGIVYLRRTVMC